MSRTYRTWKDGRKHGDREWRSRKVDRSCLNHGGCPWCENGRQYRDRKRAKTAQEAIQAYARA